MINKIKFFRKLSGFTQLEMSEILGITREYFNRIENGMNIPSVKLALMMKIVLGRSFLDDPYKLEETEIEELRERRDKVLADHEDWSPDVPLDDYET